MFAYRSGTGSWGWWGLFPGDEVLKAEQLSSYSIEAKGIYFFLLFLNCCAVWSVINLIFSSHTEPSWSRGCSVPANLPSLSPPQPCPCTIQPLWNVLGALGGTGPVPQSIPAPRVWDPGGKVGVLCPIPHCRAMEGWGISALSPLSLDHPKLQIFPLSSPGWHSTNVFKPVSFKDEIGSGYFAPWHVPKQRWRPVVGSDFPCWKKLTEEQGKFCLCQDNQEKG